MLRVILVVTVQALPDVSFPCICARKCSHFSAHPSVGSQSIGESCFVLHHIVLFAHAPLFWQFDI